MGNLFNKETELKPTPRNTSEYNHSYYSTRTNASPSPSYCIRPTPAPAYTYNTNRVTKPVPYVRNTQIEALDAYQMNLYNRVLNRCIQECEWVSVKVDVYNFPLSIDSFEYNKISNLFTKFMKRENPIIKKIERIQNQVLMGQYWLKKEEYNAKRIQIREKLLFHGTKASNVQGICKDNFDWRKHGSSKGNIFGEGVSFSPKAFYANHYTQTGNQVMFVASVLIGRACEGTETMVLPVNECDTSKKPGGDVVVKYYDDEFYPTYLIHYSAKKIHKNNNNT